MEGEGGGQSRITPAPCAACFQNNSWHVMGAQQMVASLHLFQNLLSIILLMKYRDVYHKIPHHFAKVEFLQNPFYLS